jgi:sodium/potassium-transporting ATPase subunit alpha
MKSLLKALNVIFNNTLVVFNEAYGIVIHIKNNTMLGQIARFTASKKKMKSFLAYEIDNFIKLIIVIAIAIVIIFFSIIFPVNNNNTSLAINFTVSIFIT